MAIAPVLLHSQTIETYGQRLRTELHWFSSMEPLQQYVNVALPFISWHPGFAFQQDNVRPHIAVISIDRLCGCRPLTCLDR